MKATYRRGDGILVVGGVEFPVTNVIRTLANGRRHLHVPKDVVWTMGDHKVPYMPVQFPLGNWIIGEPREVTDDDPEFTYKAPWFIPTDAVALVHEWALDTNGGYDHELTATVVDVGYGFHFSAASRTTLGCGRLSSAMDAHDLAMMVIEAHKNRDVITLSVIA